jgi:hypothetical protein
MSFTTSVSWVLLVQLSAVWCFMLSAHILSLQICRHHLPSPNKSKNDQDICIDIWLLTWLLQYLSKSCFGNDNKFLLPNHWVVLFFIYPTVYLLKILFIQPFSLRRHTPAINNERSLILVCKQYFNILLWFRANMNINFFWVWKADILTLHDGSLDVDLIRWPSLLDLNQIYNIHHPGSVLFQCFGI